MSEELIDKMKDRVSNLDWDDVMQQYEENKGEYVSEEDLDDGEDTWESKEEYYDEHCMGGAAESDTIDEIIDKVNIEGIDLSDKAKEELAEWICYVFDFLNHI